MKVWAYLHSENDTESTVIDEQRKKVFESEMIIVLGKADGSCLPNCQQ